jgi:threonine synthase
VPPAFETYTFDYNPALLARPGPELLGMWRWAPLLPVDGSRRFPLAVGGTPLVAPAQLRQELGLSLLYLKDETRGPSGSNKDRGTALCLTEALGQGATAVACASSGNVAASLATGAAAVGMPAYVFVPAGTVSPQKVEYMRSFGATIFLTEGSYEATYELSQHACQRFGWYSRNTAANPLALQGKKTVALEVWEQLDRRLPDVAFIPVGDGVTLAGFVLGCQELLRCGVPGRLPRVIGVQARGAAPLADAFAAGVAWKPTIARTVADGIGIGSPFYGDEALEAVRVSHGDFEVVSDEQILNAVGQLASRAGILVEPAGAAAFAGLVQRARREKLTDLTVVALLTGTGLKDHRWFPTQAGRALRITSNIDALTAAIDG